MAEIEAKIWLPGLKIDWHDPIKRRARIQDVVYLEALRLVDPKQAVIREAELRIGDASLQNEARVKLLGDMLDVVKGERKDGQRLAIVDETFEISEPLGMDHIDKAEDKLMDQPSPEYAITVANIFLRRLHVKTTVRAVS